jgi:ElaB/YqjD/DUF883 family membrane-anchored ribosome-binding protein
METEFEAITQGNASGITREKIKDDLKTLVHDTESLIKATAGDMSDKAKEARTRLQAALAKARETCQSLEEKTVAAAKATDRTIRAHPYESIGIAFGLGLLIGVLVARK